MLTKKQVKEIKKHLDKAQNPLFFFDNDNDGLCSFLLLQRYLGRGKGVPVKTTPALTKEYFRKVNELNPDYIFILDKPEVSEEFFEEARKINLPVVWIDHHVISKKEIPEYIHYYNPRFNRTKKDEPVTALCYQVTERKEDLWIAVIGSISDKFVPWFYPEFQKKFPEFATDSTDASEIYYSSGIGEIAKMFSFGLMDRTTNVINMLKFLIKAKNPYDVLEENPKTHSLHRRFHELHDKYRRLIEKARREVADSGKIFFFHYGGDMGMSADIANNLQYLYPEKIIVVARINEGRARLSIRGKNIRAKVVKVIENIEGATGGGHEDAVGVQINARYLEKFEQEFRKLAE